MSVVFLCVGAAKAGTSWLHQQLAGHPECHFRAIKELHYFNALENGRLKQELKKHGAQQSEMLERLALTGHAPSAEQAARLADRGAWMDVLERAGADVDAYLAYLRDGAGTRSVVGEMTPAYALLPEERLAEMARMAPDVRFLYLLRDPVERLWSHVRMMAGRRDEEGRVEAEACAHILKRTLKGREDQIAMRSDYAGALKRLGAAVPKAKLLVDVFEDMIGANGLDRICDFLGIARIKGNPAPIYEGTAIEMTTAQRRDARAWLEPQYDAAQAALGRTPQQWAQGAVA